MEKTGEFYVINFWTNEVCLTDVIQKTKEKAEEFMGLWGENFGLGTGHNLQEYFPEVKI